MENYEAGNIKNYLKQWQVITSDRTILDIVKYGLKLDFLEEIPSCKPYSIGRGYEEVNIINEEIKKLTKNQVTKITNIEHDDFFSSVFTRIKKDGSHRMILNLKHLNQYISSPHFKMDSIKTVINVVRKNSCLNLQKKTKTTFFYAKIKRL